MKGMNHARPSFRVKSAKVTETLDGEVRGGPSLSTFDQVLWARRREKRIRDEQDAAIARYREAQTKGRV